MRGNHVLKVVAHASPPLTSQPGFRQYDFFVNGQSFFTFPKVFRLGLASNDPRAASGIPHVSSGYGGGGGYDMAPSSRSMQRSRSDNIASFEAPKDHEEVRTTLTRIGLMLCSLVSRIVFSRTSTLSGRGIPQRSDQNVFARFGTCRRSYECSPTER